jgi:hypothetical protein
MAGNRLHRLRVLVCVDSPRGPPLGLPLVRPIGRDEPLRYHGQVSSAGGLETAGRREPARGSNPPAPRSPIAAVLGDQLDEHEVREGGSAGMMVGRDDEMMRNL